MCSIASLPSASKASASEVSSGRAALRSSPTGRCVTRRQTRPRPILRRYVAKAATTILLGIQAKTLRADRPISCISYAMTGRATLPDISASTQCTAQLCFARIRMWTSLGGCNSPIAREVQSLVSAAPLSTDRFGRSSPSSLTIAPSSSLVVRTTARTRTSSSSAIVRASRSLIRRSSAPRSLIRCTLGGDAIDDDGRDWNTRLRQVLSSLPSFEVFILTSMYGLWPGAFRSSPPGPPTETVAASSDGTTMQLTTLIGLETARHRERSWT